MNKIQLALLLVLNAGIACAEELEQEQATLPYSYGGVEYFDDGDPYGLELKRPVIEKDTDTKRHVNVGKAKVTVEVKNTDPLSQSQAEWESMKKSRDKKPQEKKKSSFWDEKDEEKEESHNPEASISIKWHSG